MFNVQRAIFQLYSGREKRFVLDEFLVLQIIIFFFNELNKFILDLIYTCVYVKVTKLINTSLVRRISFFFL